MAAEAERFDAVIVGSGAGGAPVAWALVSAGWRVLLLERGEHYRDQDFFHDEIAVCRRNFFLPDALTDGNMVSRAGAPPQRSMEGWIACCVGGGTVHMSGFFFRMRAEDFRVRARLGAGEDWPFGLDTLAPFYDEVEKVVGVSGEGQVLPPIALHPAGKLLDDAATRMGLRAQIIPRGVLSQPYGGRNACLYCGFCGSYGCEAGAKSSTLATFVALAQATGKLTLRPRAQALRVEADAGKARGVVYAGADGVERRAEGRVVVVAGSAIQSARLLLASGLANGSGELGKNLLFSAYSSGFGRFERKPEVWAPAGQPDLPFVDRCVRERDGTILFLLPHVNPIFQAERLASENGEEVPVWGAALKRRMKEFFLDTRTIEVETFAEFLPHEACRVSLDPEAKDPHGVPAARVDIAIQPASVLMAQALEDKGRGVLTLAGARRAARRPGEDVYAVLQAGTARMGTDPERSVLTPSCETHEVKNLFVSDGSGFPSAGSAPFTLTIMANALRVGREIVERGRKGEL